MKEIIFYKVLWESFPPECATWEPASNIHDDFIDEYEAALEAEATLEAEAQARVMVIQGGSFQCFECAFEARTGASPAGFGAEPRIFFNQVFTKEIIILHNTLMILSCVDRCE